MSTAPAVVAVVLGPDGRGQETCRASLRAQPAPPETVLTGEGALEQALETGTRLLWFLEAGAVAHPDALARLLEARQDSEDEPELLTGLVVDPQGAPIDTRLPAGREAGTAEVVEMVPRRRLPIRSAPFAHVLVARTAFLRHGLPDVAAYGPHAPVEWSARVLAAAPGYLVAESVVVLPRGGASALRTRAAELPATLRMTRTPAWTRGEGVRALAALARGGS